MADISQTYEMHKVLIFWFKFHWMLFLRVQMRIIISWGNGLALNRCINVLLINKYNSMIHWSLHRNCLVLVHMTSYIIKGITITDTQICQDPMLVDLHEVNGILVACCQTYSISSALTIRYQSWTRSSIHQTNGNVNKILFKSVTNLLETTKTELNSLHWPAGLTGLYGCRENYARR